MADPYLGELRVFPFGFAPKGWAQCDGQLLSISQNQALFSLLGTTYGGDGKSTFALPDLTGRVPVHVSPTLSLGQKGGEETHTLSAQEIPVHTHLVMAADTTPTEPSPASHVWGNNANFYGEQVNASMNAATVFPMGGSGPHLNMQPYTVFNICISLVGEYPPHS